MLTLIPHSLTGMETLQNGAQAAARPQAQGWDRQHEGRARGADHLEGKGVLRHPADRGHPTGALLAFVSTSAVALNTRFTLLLVLPG